MKVTGIVRRVDDLGRIVIPKELRRTMQISEGEPLDIYVEGETIVLKKFTDSRHCTFCGNEAEHILCHKGVCLNCIKTLKLRLEEKTC